MNKIFYIISIGLVVAICVALIASSIIPYRFNSFESMGVEKPLQIKVYQNSSTADPLFYYADGVEEAKKNFNKYYNGIKNSFSTTVINALFTKRLGEKSSYKYANENLENVIEDSDNAVEFIYNEFQQLEKNNKTYISKEMAVVNSSYYRNESNPKLNGAIKFKSIIFTWENEKKDGFKQMNVYVRRLMGDTISSYSVVKISTLSNVKI